MINKLKSLNPLILIFISILIFSPGLFTFFSADDWFHLRISQAGSFNDFVSFFSFIPSEHSSSFYRPIPTQFFFFIFQTLVGLNQIYYHLFVYSFFGLSLLILYKVTYQITKNKTKSLLTLFFYSLSASHFTRLYFLSAFQEILMFLFVLLSLCFYFRKKSLSYIWSIIFFLLSLASKETAIVLPILLLVLEFFFYKKISNKIIIFIAIGVIFLFLRLYLFGSVAGDSYTWEFSLKKLINTYFWYGLWSLGAPEFLVDYVSSGFKILPRLFEVLPFWSQLLLTTMTLTIFILVINFIFAYKKLTHLSILGFVIFIIGILPVAFLPWHKFTLELTLPLFGFCLLLTDLVSSNLHLSKNNFQFIKNSFLNSFVIFYLFLNLITIFLTYRTSYTVSRAKISQKVFHYVTNNYPNFPANQKFAFINDLTNVSKEWGLSKQIFFATSGSDMFKVIYKDPNIKVYFEDLDNIPEDSIKIGSLQFLR